MSSFEPKFSVTDLQKVNPGTPVIYNREIAFAGVNQGAPGRPMMLAAYDPQLQKFVHRYDAGQQQVLVVDEGLIIRPNLKSYTENLPLHPSNTNLFIEGEPFIVVQLPTLTDTRLLSLASGSLLSVRSAQMHGFTSWEIGFVVQREFVSLFKV